MFKKCNTQINNNKFQSILVDSILIIMLAPFTSINLSVQAREFVRRRNIIKLNDNKQRY
jgi:hypothetical protein